MKFLDIIKTVRRYSENTRYSYLSKRVQVCEYTFKKINDSDKKGKNGVQILNEELLAS